jgi:hypothetical protein
MRLPRLGSLSYAALLTAGAVAGAGEKLEPKPAPAPMPAPVHVANIHTTTAGKITTILPVKKSWDVLKTDNFILHHHQTPKEAAEIAARAEKIRTDIRKQWLGLGGEKWQVPCRTFLFESAKEYTEATGVDGYSSPGHTKTKVEHGRVVEREMYMRGDWHGLKNLFDHEATHTVVAAEELPRWADEALAMMNETEEIRAQHRKNLTEKTELEAFPMHTLLQMRHYPSPARTRLFYAQSLSVAEYLVAQKSKEVFITFIRDAKKKGYDAALQQHFGFSSTDELFSYWHMAALGGKAITMITDE